MQGLGRARNHRPSRYLAYKGLEQSPLMRDPGKTGALVRSAEGMSFWMLQVCNRMEGGEIVLVRT